MRSLLFISVVALAAVQFVPAIFAGPLSSSSSAPVPTSTAAASPLLPDLNNDEIARLLSISKAIAHEDEDELQTAIAFKGLADLINNGFTGNVLRRDVDERQTGTPIDQILDIISKFLDELLQRDVDVNVNVRWRINKDGDAYRHGSDPISTTLHRRQDEAQPPTLEELDEIHRALNCVSDLLHFLLLSQMTLDEGQTEEASRIDTYVVQLGGVGPAARLLVWNQGSTLEEQLLAGGQPLVSLAEELANIPFFSNSTCLTR